MILCGPINYVWKIPQEVFNITQNGVGNDRHSFNRSDRKGM